MDSQIYMQIAEKILSQATCPHCGAPLRDCAYDILVADGEKIVLELDCDTCDAVLLANGIFQKKSRVNMPRQQQKGRRTVSPETVRGIKSALREFRGQDIQDLLQK
jgi:hypothetical protein